MITPYPKKFTLSVFQITEEILLDGYVVISKIPDLNTVEVIVSEENDILYSEYIVEEVTSSNAQLYPKATIGQYVVSWITQPSSSSSSSSTGTELKLILEARVGHMFLIKYVSIN